MFELLLFLWNFGLLNFFLLVGQHEHFLEEADAVRPDLGLDATDGRTMLGSEHALFSFEALLISLHQCIILSLLHQSFIVLCQLLVHRGLLSDFGKLSLDLLLLLVRIRILGPVWDGEIFIDALLSGFFGHL